jgi:hypothetical protein
MSDDVIQVQSDSDPRPPVSPPAPEIFIVKSEKSGMYALVVSGDGQTRLCRGTDATHLRRRVISCLAGEYRLPMEMAQGLAGEVPELADQPESPREKRGGGDQLRHQPHDDHPPPTDQERRGIGAGGWTIRPTWPFRRRRRRASIITATTNLSPARRRSLDGAQSARPGAG